MEKPFRTPLVLPSHLEIHPSDSVLAITSWKSQMPDPKNCYRTCEQIAGYTAGKKDALQILNLSGVQLPVIELTSLLKRIDTSISSRNPVIAGVYYKNKDQHTENEKLADHYVVIVGAGFDEKRRKYYRYFDPRTIHKDKGTNPLNRFFIDNADSVKNLVSDTTSIAGTVQQNYILAQIRPRS